ncbi:protein POLR1D-like [Puntigrus tetrazona]|uniref:protein POLR1D-like n=1 Tax=Puntigrus tetrazona TaxID=1606681 RepID=UPI001C8ADA3A|nr:protein POLR1D-like [Puntigrus tetrazona]
MDETELERKAVEELLKETSRAKVRAETMGATGWMKCPLGSTNKRFLLNTLRTSAVRGQPAHQRASERDRDEHRYKRACEKHRNTDCEKCNHKKDYSHRRHHSDSHSHASKRRSSSHNHSPSRRRHSPHLSRKSKRTRSRSPVRDSSPDVKKYTDKGGK